MWRWTSSFDLLSFLASCQSLLPLFPRHLLQQLQEKPKEIPFSTLVYYSKSCLWVLRCQFESIHASNQTAHNFRCQKEISIFRYLELFFDYLKILTDYRSVRIYQTFLDRFYQYFVQSLLWFHQDQFGWRNKVVLEPQCLKWIKLFRMWAMRLEITWPFYAWFKNDQST